MNDTALVVALALFAGIVAQALATHLRLPGIVLLLAAGVLLGPDGANIIQPDKVGPALQTLVGYAVAIILFEGGMNLNLSRLRRESTVIRRLITYGALITGIGGTITARLVMGWSWQLSLLFGTLVIVTGPTVINPLLRRIKIKRSIETILEAEGVLIDPIGAIIALVALEAIIHPLQGPFWSSVLSFALRLGSGAVIGFAGGMLIVLILRPRKLIPENLINVFVLSAVLALYHLSNALQPESGIGAVTVAGLAVGNFSNRVLRELMEFKEQLTMMLIGMLFVLLAADVRISEIQQLGIPGLITVGILMLVIRPINIWACTFGSDISANEKAFMSWLAPRGIVAAAVASLFALSLNDAGLAGGTELRAMVFLVIAATVLLQGMSGGLVARQFGVKRLSNNGYAILGANEVGRMLGLALQEGGERVIIVDSNPGASNAAEGDGLKAVFGNAFEENIIQRARLEDMAACIGLTPNEEVNLLFARMAGKDLKVSRLYVTLLPDKGHVTPEMIHEIGAKVLFGAQRDIDTWSVRIRRNQVVREVWQGNPEDSSFAPTEFDANHILNRAILPLAYTKGKKIFPADETMQTGKDTTFILLIFQDLYDEAAAWLKENGFTKGSDSSEEIKNKEE